MPGKLASRVRGLSEAQFRAAYGTEEQCRAVVEKLRWPKGFVCPLCGSCEGKRLSTRPKVQCRACRHQVSLTAGTIFHATKLPLTSWFLAMWLVATAKNGISSVELGRRLGIKQTNARALKQKIMAVMAEREGQKRLDGRVEMDDAYLGGHRPGRRGRGAAGKQPFVAAVSTGRLVTDGLSCWTAAAEAGLEHTAMVTGGGKRAAGWSPFRWVNTTLGNVKAAITGTYRRVSHEHAWRYLGSFAWRHNRRFQLDSLIPRLVHSAVRTAPLPYAKLVAS